MPMQIEGIHPSSDTCKYAVVPVIVGGINSSTESEHITSVSNSLSVYLASALSKTLDSIDVGLMSPGSVLTVTTGTSITTTSTQISLLGYNSVLLYVQQGGTSDGGSWTITMNGALVSGSTPLPWYNGTTQMATTALTESRGISFVNVPPYATFTLVPSSSPLTNILQLKVLPFNV